MKKFKLLSLMILIVAMVFIVISGCSSPSTITIEKNGKMITVESDQIRNYNRYTFGSGDSLVVVDDYNQDQKFDNKEDDVIFLLNGKGVVAYGSKVVYLDGQRLGLYEPHMNRLRQEMITKAMEYWNFIFADTTSVAK